MHLLWSRRESHISSACSDCTVGAAAGTREQIALYLMPGGYRVFTVKGIATPFTARNAEHAGGMDIWTPGLNWRLTPIFAVSVNYRRITLNRFGSKGKSSGVLALVVLLLE